MSWSIDWRANKSAVCSLACASVRVSQFCCYCARASVCALVASLLAAKLPTAYRWLTQCNAAAIASATGAALRVTYVAIACQGQCFCGLLCFQLLSFQACLSFWIPIAFLFSSFLFPIESESKSESHKHKHKRKHKLIPRQQKLARFSQIQFSLPTKTHESLHLLAYQGEISQGSRPTTTSVALLGVALSHSFLSLCRPTRADKYEIRWRRRESISSCSSLLELAAKSAANLQFPAKFRTQLKQRQTLLLLLAPLLLWAWLAGRPTERRAANASRRQWQQQQQQQQLVCCRWAVRAKVRKMNFNLQLEFFAHNTNNNNFFAKNNNYLYTNNNNNNCYNNYNYNYNNVQTTTDTKVNSRD